MIQVALGLDFFITLWHSEQVKVSRLGMVTGITKLFLAGWWSGWGRSEFGMIIVAGRLQQLHDRRPCFRCSLYAAWLCIKMRCGIADSACCPVVVESEANFAFAAQDLRVRALVVIGMVPLLLNRPAHTAAAFGGLTSDRYNMSRPSLSLISCKLHTVVQVPGLSQHHQLVVGEELLRRHLLGRG